MILSQTQAELNVALEIVSKSELKRVRLHRCHASLEGEADRLKGPFKLVQSHTSTANAILDNTLRIEVGFHFESFAASEERALLFSVECSFDLDYQLEEGFQPKPEAIEAFKNGNAVFNCWPYARECVQSITSRMGLNPPPLPLLRILPKKPEPKITTPPQAAETASAPSVASESAKFGSDVVPTG